MKGIPLIAPRLRYTGKAGGRPVPGRSPPRCRLPCGSRNRNRARSACWPGQAGCRGARADGVDADALFQERHRLSGNVGADCLLARHVVGFAVLHSPLRRGVEVGDVEVFLQQREVLLPAQPGRRGDEADRRAARERVGGQQSVDQVPVADEIDLLDAGGAVRDAGALRELGDRGAHPGGTAHHQDTLAVVPERVEQRHVQFLLRQDIDPGWKPWSAPSTAAASSGRRVRRSPIRTGRRSGRRRRRRRARRPWLSRRRSASGPASRRVG